MFSDVELIYDKRIEDTLRTRFGTEIHDLESEGFAIDGVLKIRHRFPLFPSAVVFGMLGREVWEFEFPFCVNWYHPVMRSADGSTIGYPFGLGMRYYSFFDDGSSLRTSACQDEESVKFMERCQLLVANLTEKTARASWMRHLAFIDQHKNQGKQPLRSNTTPELVSIQNREDQLVDLLIATVVGWGGLLGGFAALYALVCAW